MALKTMKEKDIARDILEKICPLTKFYIFPTALSTILHNLVAMFG